MLSAMLQVMQVFFLTLRLLLEFLMFLILATRLLADITALAMVLSVETAELAVEVATRWLDYTAVFAKVSMLEPVEMFPILAT